MVKKSSTEPVPPPKLIVPRLEAQGKIEAHLQRGRKIRDLLINSDEDVDRAEAEETKWRNYTIDLLSHIFSNPSKADKYAEKTSRGSFSLGGKLHYTEEAKYFRRRMDSSITELESILEGLEIIPELVETSTPQESSDHSISLSKKVFIVHGHDEVAKESVGRFIHQLGLSPVILNEQPNEGWTIIEKFEKSSNKVGYAVVLLTPDDIGTSKNKPEELKPRARQNVIFELGYFAAKLGRKRVCALYKGGIEIPSDYHGVAYVSMDSDDWKTRLAVEIKQSIPIDLNRAFIT